MKTDRYVRTGTEIPAIYPGTTLDLMQAASAALAASTLDDGEHLVEAVRGGEREVVRSYVGGECLFFFNG